ncbi:hypothetical protein D9756_005175 [Leucocoprinus leucothites]|uniref:F-box domain-containing protein n=1 Tax=Leucocoprinus leucothites TaxID=201217 RepID=A0A8H5G9Z0_9AGAR|nr:hypothetical protein D9756_005175 [Leucoagaricus leucothites]
MASPYLPSTNTALSRDILLEIVRYYRLEPFDPLAHTKRTQLRALALVSRQLHEIARPEIWRTARTIRHVRRYIELVEDAKINKSLSPWGLNEPLLPETRDHVLELLSYTRNFAPHQWNSDDFVNSWCFVTMSLDLLHLFPNLELLLLDWAPFHPHSNDSTRKAYIALLATQTIERVVHYRLRREDRGALILLHNTLRAQKAPINYVEISNWEELDPGMLPLLLSTSAPVLSFKATRPPSHRTRYRDLFLVLSGCPTLSTLTIEDAALNDPPNWVFSCSPLHFTKLSSLEIHGKDLQYHKLFRQLDCPALVSLTLHLKAFENWRDTFSAMSSFKKLQNVVVTVVEGNRELRLEDLKLFLEELSIKRLRILGVASQMTEDDVTELLALASTMKSLIIEGPKSTPLSLSVIKTISHQPFSCMEEICLPIDFTTAIPLPAAPPAHPRTNVVKRLLIHSGSILPQTMRSKIKVAEYIGDLLPSAIIQPLAEESTFGSIVRDVDELRSYIGGKAK